VESRESAWPPERADQYFRSEAFGKVMLEIVQLLTKRYRHIDFSDAIATAFVWFESRGKKDPEFLRAGKFPTFGAFRAYVRQALWNSARAAERNRRAHKELNAPEMDSELVSPCVSPVWLAAFHECRDRLPKTLRSVFDIMQDEIDPPDGLSRDAWAALVMNLDAEQVDHAYREACNRIRQCMEREHPTIQPDRKE
jgi:hypothetical protein